MGLRRHFLFLAIVLCTAPAPSFAAKEAPTVDFDEPTVRQPEPDPDPGRARDTVDIAAPPPAPNLPPTEREVFYPYRRAITFRLGSAISSVTTNDTNTPLVAGVQLLFPTESLDLYEAGADLLSDGTGDLQFTRRVVFGRSRLRPYLKYGAELIVNPKDQLGAFAQYGNLHALGSAGFEYLLRMPQSLRLDFEADVGVKSQILMASLGYVWAW